MGIKEILNQAKKKLYDTIEKGNSEIKKYSASTKMTIYSRPILGGFITKQVFLESDGALVVSTDFKDEDIIVHSIIKIEGKDDILVIEKIEAEEQMKSILVDGKIYTYPCHKIYYRSLNDVFTEETFQFSYHELSPNQQMTLNFIKEELEKKTFAVKEKKEVCFKLWQYFTECISYHLMDHYIVDTFVRIADDYIDDFSSILLKLVV